METPWSGQGQYLIRLHLEKLKLSLSGRALA
jgi:hypothetical protein